MPVINASISQRCVCHSFLSRILLADVYQIDCNAMKDILNYFVLSWQIPYIEALKLSRYDIANYILTLYLT